MAGFADYEEEVRECLEKAKTSNASIAASNVAEARDMVQQVKEEADIGVVFILVMQLMGLILVLLQFLLDETRSPDHAPLRASGSNFQHSNNRGPCLGGLFLIPSRYDK